MKKQRGYLQSPISDLWGAFAIFFTASLGHITLRILASLGIKKSRRNLLQTSKTLLCRHPLIFFTIFLSGCAVGPNYSPPENTVTQEWAKKPGEDEISVTNQEPITEWWKVFNDELLTKYIEKASIYNNDVQAAEANVLQARAMRQVAASALFPQISADLNATKSYFSKNGPLFASVPSTGNIPGIINPATGLPFGVQQPQIQNLFNALFDMTWEIDLFGKTRRQVEAAKATIQSTIETRNDTLISVMAEIARNYMELRGFQRRAKLVEENIHVLEQESEIVSKQLEYGYANKLDYENIQARLSTARSTLPNITAEIYRGIYTLSILTGEFPEALVDELLPEKPLPKAPVEIAVGLRSDLLRRRPDIRYAERQMAVATANVGVAVASFFPTITLIGDGGFQSLNIRNLFTMASRTWAIGGDANIPIFQGGSLIGNLKASRAISSAAVYMYQQTVLNALEETESTLISYNEDLATSRQLLETTDTNRTLVGLTEERHNKGLIGLLDVLTSKEQLISAELSLLTSDTSALIDLVSLYKALGGGWKIKEN